MPLIRPQARSTQHGRCALISNSLEFSCKAPANTSQAVWTEYLRFAQNTHGMNIRCSSGNLFFFFSLPVARCQLFVLCVCVPSSSSSFSSFGKYLFVSFNFFIFIVCTKHTQGAEWSRPQTTDELKRSAEHPSDHYYGWIILKWIQKVEREKRETSDERIK